MDTRRFLISLCIVVAIAGCRQKYRDDLDYSYRVVQTHTLEDLLADDEIVQFESVFWEPDDTVSLRKMIVDDRVAAGRNVLEIGTGTGILAILCMQNDAKSVIATDINPAAVACAKYNTAIAIPDEYIDVRQVLASDPSAFSALGQSEKFDLIISNPPWEDGVVTKPADHAFYDPSFALMDTLLDGLPQRLTAGGRCLLAYGHVPAIRRLEQESKRRGYQFKILDDRDLDSLEPDFLPGMLIEIRPPASREVVSGNGFASQVETESDEGAKTDDSSQADDKGKDENTEANSSTDQ